MTVSPYTEALTRSWFEWVARGRGTDLYPFPVSLEPSFRPFFHRSLSADNLDDRRRHTVRSFLAELVLGNLRGPSAPDEESDPGPKPCHRGDLLELRLNLPRDFRLPRDTTEGFLRALLVLGHPLSWEVASLGGSIRYGVAIHGSDYALLRAAVSAFLPSVALSEGRVLEWKEGGESQVFDFAVEREFVVPLGVSLQPDPLLPLLCLLSQMEKEEFCALQVLFAPARQPWRESILRLVRTPAGLPFFSDAPEITRLGEEKIGSPLCAVAVRLAVGGPSRERVAEFSRLARASLTALGRENHLQALSDNPNALSDFLRRESHRAGMLLSLPELAALVHLPAGDVPVPGLVRGRRIEKEPPPEALGDGVFLGEVSYRAASIRVFLPEEARLRHTHVIGATGAGKTTLLLNLILEDIRAGRGVGVVDPHGDMTRELLSRIPEERFPDLVLIDPSDPEVGTGWNALEARSEAEREVLSSDLVALFRRYSTSFGDQMVTVLSNAVAVLVSLPEEYTISDLRRFFVDRRFRESLIPRISDEELSFFWHKEYSHIGERSLGPILGRLNTFVRSRAIRESVTRRGGIDFRRLLDKGGILIARLPLGLLGEENVSVLGSLLISKLHQTALSRTDKQAGERNAFHLFLDEFHLFATPSLSHMLSGARKFGLSLTLAHQSLTSLHGRLSEVEGSILANCHTRLVFRVGEEDCRTLERSLSTFAADDLLDLKTGEAICRLGAKENTFRVSVPLPQRLSAGEEMEALTRVRTYLLSKRGIPEPQREAEPPASRLADPAPVPYQAEPRATRASCPSPPPSLGRGGPKHQYLQELLKQWGEDCGYLVTVEKSVLDGQGKVDVALEREGWSLACEISVTSTVDQEVGNIEKCLAAGFSEVAAVSLKTRALQKLRAALAKRIGEEKLSRVHFFTPEELYSYLETDPGPKERVESVGGYRVRVSYQQSEEAHRRTNAVAGVIARSLKRLQRGGE